MAIFSGHTVAGQNYTLAPHKVATAYRAKAFLMAVGGITTTVNKGRKAGSIGSLVYVYQMSIMFLPLVEAKY